MSGREGKRGGSCQRTCEKAFFSFCRALEEDDIVLLLPASSTSEQNNKQGGKEEKKKISGVLGFGRL